LDIVDGAEWPSPWPQGLGTEGIGMVYFFHARRAGVAENARPADNETKAKAGGAVEPAR